MSPEDCNCILKNLLIDISLFLPSGISLRSLLLVALFLLLLRTITYLIFCSMIIVIVVFTLFLIIEKRDYYGLLGLLGMFCNLYCILTLYLLILDGF